MIAPLERRAPRQRRRTATRYEYGSKKWVRELARRSPSAALRWLQTKINEGKVEDFQRRTGRKIRQKRYRPPLGRGRSQRLRVMDGPKIAGYAASFWDGTNGTQFELLDGLFERIAPNAFDGIDETDCRALFNHNPDKILGRVSAGTLRLMVDDCGLRYVVDVPESRNDVLEAVARGDVRGSSFGFAVTEDRVEHYDTHAIRWLIGLKVFDVSPVTFPAYKSTERMRSRVRK